MERQTSQFACSHVATSTRTILTASFDSSRMCVHNAVMLRHSADVAVQIC